MTQTLKSLGFWSEEEDKKLEEILTNNPLTKWKDVAKYLGNDRTSKQCRERWVNHLNPNINHQIWTEEEEWILYLIQKIIGNKWSQLKRLFKQRSENDIKNHWHAHIQKKIKHFDECLGKIARGKKTSLYDFEHDYAGLKKHSSMQVQAAAQASASKFKKLEQYLIKIIKKNDKEFEEFLVKMHNQTKLKYQIE